MKPGQEGSLGSSAPITPRPGRSIPTLSLLFRVLIVFLSAFLSILSACRGTWRLNVLRQSLEVPVARKMA